MLRRRIQWGTHLGLVKAGDRLPSLRAAASEFGVDQRSVLAAYRELESEGIVVMRPRSGIYVAGERQPVHQQITASNRWMAEMFLQGFSRGVPPVALGPALASAVNPGAMTAACLECNADQILWLASQLRNEFGLSTTWVDLGALSDETLAERLRASNLIVTTAFHAAEARVLSERFGLPVVIATASRDQATYLRAELGRGPVYFVGTDERYARKLLDASDSARWMANLRPLVVDRGGLKSTPNNGPVVVTRAAADILGEDNLPANSTILDYPFAAETRSEIIAIMLGAGRQTNAQACEPIDRETEVVYDAVVSCLSANESDLSAHREALREAATNFARSRDPERATLTDVVEDALHVFDRLATAGTLPRCSKRLQADFITWLVEDFKSASPA
jgi:hypothetical protein